LDQWQTNAFNIFDLVQTPGPLSRKNGMEVRSTKKLKYWTKSKSRNSWLSQANEAKATYAQALAQDAVQ
jgi:hypothetical protein